MEVRDAANLHVRTDLLTEISPTNTPTGFEKPPLKACGVNVNTQQVKGDYHTLGTGNSAPDNWLKSRPSHQYLKVVSSKQPISQGMMVWVSHGHQPSLAVSAEAGG